MQLKRCYCYQLLSSLLTLLSLFFTSISHAGSASSVAQLQMPHSKLSATIDGELDDEIWLHAKSFSLQTVNYPWNNEPSPVKTTAKIIENGEYIYISFLAHDPNPEQIQAFLGDRDSRWADDIVGIKLDTYNNRRLNYELFVNPFGVQMDSIKNVMKGTTNDSWDGIWDSFGKITKQGYQVEMALPYRMLNFKDNNKDKIWALELIRLYPRDTRLRISHIALDRDNDCWLCQIPEFKGFKQAKTGKNITVTPAIVANKNDTRDIYLPQDDWHSDKEVEAGVDLRWGINANTLLNVTLNPDFSTVESDAGQLSVNKTYSLFYQEKRPFFLDNADYFSSNYDLVYTRNIADPDYGAKLTGTQNAHNYAFFITNDTETNFIVPGNTGSEIASLNTESHSAALKYRYDFNDDFSIGAISTLRQADDYHNYVFGLDSKYRIDESNTLTGQVLNSSTQYPNTLYQDFCYGDELTSCDQSQSKDCLFGNCPYSEQVHRTREQDEFSGNALKASYLHSSEFWNFTAEHQSINQGFRADLGFMPRADFRSNRLLVDRLFYGERDSLWQEMKISGQWQIKHNQQGELLEKSLTSSFGIDGPMQSYFEASTTFADKVGLRHDESLLAIDNNTRLFNEKILTVYGGIQLTPGIFAEAEIRTGDKIDYRNDRLGDYDELYASVSYNITRHLQADLNFTHSQLSADHAYVYKANLSELRVSYQFDVHSYLKLNLVHSDVDRNPNNNPYSAVSNTNKSLSTQLIYAYKLNPQTVFYLGYSDSSYQDDYLNDLTREQRTFFTKISYAWMP
ncbi:carbohydrate binding family 9 domain-containing protein [Thalassotalea sp. G2M2-11]|uniref:carbohydrate binding family 9 domain-containing protein n=1 Tax=Thalassotalea sp. G2M2-11 TaxID=2787627 RepID=UPI0019D292A8|nr:carbohydrate binding family 9 domain-containing protein [Thalassotalea sp. G2M2-11]